MAIGDPVIGSELGPEFDQDTIQANTIRLKLGAGLAIQPDGTIVATGAQPTLNVIKAPVYEYRDIWAEEGGGTNANNAEWSFGNGATGLIGLPIDAGWEVEAMYFQADTFAAAGIIRLDLMDYGGVPGTGAGDTIAFIQLNDSTDGGGVTNNAYKYEQFATPALIPTVAGNTVIGFLTRGESGNIADARVGARLRRLVAEYVTDVQVA